MQKGLLFTCLLAMVSAAGFAQNDKFWSANTESRSAITPYKAVTRLSFPKEFTLFNLNTDAIRQQLFSVVDKTSNPSTVITLPNASGNLEQFEVYEASNFEPALQAQFPQIRAYSGRGISDKYATLKLSISPQGLQGMIFRTEISNEFIEPYSNDRTVYAVYRSKRDKGQLPWSCTTDEKNMFNNMKASIGTQGMESATGASAGTIKTLRLAQSCNGEYANYFGATSAAQVDLVMAAFNATMTRTNGCYEKDLALHLNLIPTTTSVIYYSPSSDPYSTQLSQWNLQLQQTLTNVIGSANYDIGHMFGASGGGGNAGCIGCVCVNPASSNSLAKGSGITSPADGIPEGDNFDIDYVAHEVGHQLGGNHTFSMSNEGTGVNKEVGSGITIMGYAGITAQDVAPHSIDVFHQATIAQIQANMAPKTCPVTTTMANRPPVISPVSNYTIPISTPFALTANATDPDGNAITYNWEQNDNSSTTGTGSVASPTKATGPNWLTFPSSITNTRCFPRLSTILAGQNVTGPLPGGDAGANIEALSSVSRTLNFRVTVRDNAPYVAGQSIGQTAFTDAVVTVTNTSGPFAVTSPNTNITWPASGAATVTWSVNGTTLAPVSCASVNILLSTDGGQTFPIVLASGTPNDGSETITVPASQGTTNRIKVESVGNIFFDISNSNFTIGTAPVCGATTGLAASNITQTSATVSWSALAGANSYDVDYKTASTSIWLNAATGTTATSVNLSGLVASTAYDWRVRANCTGGSGSYTQGQFSTSGTTPPACPGQYDVSTNGSTSGAATIPLNTDVFGRIEVRNDVDYYRFSVLTGGSVTITLQNLPADYQLALHNSSGTVLQSSVNTGTANESITRTLTAGTYYARVYPRNKNAFNAGTCYRLRVQSAIARTADAPSMITKLAVSPNPARNSVNLAFRSEVAGNTVVTVISQTGSVVLSKTLAVNEGENIRSLDVAKLPAGLYFVKVQTAGVVQMAKLVIAK